MNKPFAILVVVAASLGFLAVDQTFLGHRQSEPPFLESVEELNRLLVDGYQAGDPYWVLSMGLRHRLGGWLPEGVQRDSAFGVSLIEQAMESGYAHAGDMWVHYVDRTVVGSRRAAAVGSRQGIRQLAFAEALGHCDGGTLPPGTMEAFVEEYQEELSASHYLDFAPPELPSWPQERFAGLESELREDILVDIPAHFEDMCGNQELYESILGG